MRVSALLVIAALLSACGPSSTLDDSFFIRSRGADMPVWVRGDLADSKVMLVLIAGGPGGPGIYYADQPAFVRLSRKYGLALWDQRLSGSSMGNAGVETLTIDQYVADLDAVVQVLKQRHGDPKIVLMGWSWGGLLGTAYLSSSPARQQRIAGWINVDGLHNLAAAEDLSRSWAIARAQERIARGEAVDRWERELAWYADHPSVGIEDRLRHAENLTALGGGARHPENDPGLGSAWMNLIAPFNGLLTAANGARVQGELDQEGSVMRAALYTDLTASLAGLTLPSLVVWGEHDGGVPLAHGEEAFTRLGTPVDQKSLVVLHDAAHNAPLDEPEGFAAAVETFVERLR